MIIKDNTILVIEGVRHWFWARAILRQQVQGDKVLHHAKQVQKGCKFICNGRTDGRTKFLVEVSFVSANQMFVQRSHYWSRL